MIKFFLYFFFVSAAMLNFVLPQGILGNIYKTLSTEDEKIILYAEFNSNFIHLTNTAVISNVYFTNTYISNEQIISIIESDNNFFNDRKKYCEFLNTAAELTLYWNYRNEKRTDAYLYWQKIIEIDLSGLSMYGQPHYSNYQSDAALKTLHTAFEMDYFSFITAGTGSRISNTNFINNYQEYVRYYERGLRYGPSFAINIAVYFLEKDDWQKAFAVLNNDNLHTYYFLYDRILHAKMSAITNNFTLFTEMKNYIHNALSRSELRYELSDSYYNYATEMLAERDISGNLHYKYRDIKTDDSSKIEKAIEYYLKSLEIKQTYEIFFNLGLLYEKSGQYFKALFYLQEALKKKTTYDVLISLGLTELRVKNYSGAYAYFYEALIISEMTETKDSMLYNNLAICSQYNKDIEIKNKALYYIDRAIEIDNRNFNFLITRAEILKMRGDEKQYQIHLKESVKKLEFIEKDGYEHYLNVFNVTETNDMPVLIQNKITEINEWIGETQE